MDINNFIPKQILFEREREREREMASNNFYSSVPTTQKVPPPPPRQRVAAVGSTGRTTTRQNNANDTSTTTTMRSSKSNPYSQSRSTTTTNNRLSRPTGTAIGKNPIVTRRPVGSYYNTSSTTAPTSTPTPAFGSDLPDNDSNNSKNNWDDWSVTDNLTTTTAAATSTMTAPNNNPSSWAPSSSNISNPTVTGVVTNNANNSSSDWYSSGGVNTNSATSTGAGVSPSLYQSSGFTNSNNATTQAQNNQSIEPVGNGFYPSNGSVQQQPFLSGAMDSSAPTMMAINSNGNNSNGGDSGSKSSMPSFSMFIPTMSNQQEQQQDGGNMMYPSFEDEAPLLEELGINIQHILLKIKAVVLPFTRFGGDQIDPSVICQDGDIVGPVFLLLLLGGEMVLTGKIQFGFIYIYALFGTMMMTIVVNLISPNDPVSFFTVFSIMGYSILPVNVLALVKVFIMNLIHMDTFGNILGGLTILWSTFASTRLLEQGCGLDSQRYLIFYPLFLFFSAFVMMTIF